MVFRFKYYTEKRSNLPDLYIGKLLLAPREDFQLKTGTYRDKYVLFVDIDAGYSRTYTTQDFI